ncbi:hypothetical protein NQ318_006095 [Aromia moschata]|uniref:Uncharacterized protein n=1 Tax=Aromia moschata TaxID=1265417 RepID=A0AAV8Z2Q2_9CUCU|nr:hypothetical protein NQ318_006095 [Aromia moschata]
MFKFVVLFAVVCLGAGAPAPGFLHGGYALPAATSYASRVDVVHSAPILKTVVAAPVVTKTVVAAPAISYAAPIVTGYGLGGHGLEGHGLEGHGYGLGWGLQLGAGPRH